MVDEKGNKREKKQKREKPLVESTTPVSLQTL
jgi:hypothetical protein